MESRCSFRPRWSQTAVAALLLGAPLAAAAQIYRCENANGVVEYSNSPASSKDKSCRPVDLPSVTTIPAPKLPPGGQRGSAAPSGGQGGAGVAPAGFPRVEPGAQKSRDNDRRRILEDELRKEEGKLADLRREYNGGEPERRGDERNYQRYIDRVERLKDEIARSESTVASLRREIGSVRD